MPKFTPLRERVLVATATKNTAEIRRIKNEIVDAYKSSGRTVVATAKRLGVNQLTLRRVAEELDIEQELSIDRSRGETSLLVARARAAVESGDKGSEAAIRSEILSALKRTDDGSVAGAARILGVSPWILNKTIDVLGIDSDAESQSPRRYSVLGERILIAQRTQDEKELDKIRSEVLFSHRKSKGDIDRTSHALGITTQTLRRISRTLGISTELGFEEQSSKSVILTSRLRVALEAGDRAAVTQIKKEVIEAFEASGGMLRYAAPILGVGENALRQVIADLGMKVEIAEKFPGMGKERMLTVRVDGKTITQSIAEWSKFSGAKRTTIIERLRRGYTPEQAIVSGDLREKRGSNSQQD